MSEIRIETHAATMKLNQLSTVLLINVAEACDLRTLSSLLFAFGKDSRELRERVWEAALLRSRTEQPKFAASLETLANWHGKACRGPRATMTVAAGQMAFGMIQRFRWR